MIKLSDKNISYAVENGKLKIEVDLSKNLGPSKSGKSSIVATSRGAIPIDGGNGKSYQLNLNLYA